MEIKDEYYVLTDLAQYPGATPQEISERTDLQVEKVKRCLSQARNKGRCLKYHGQGGVRGRGGEVASLDRDVEEDMWCLTQEGYNEIKELWQDVFPVYNELVDALSVGARFVPEHVVQGDQEDES